MNEDFITYELAVKLKEKGFDWQTFDWYDMAGNFCKGFMPRELMCREYYAPTISQVLKWLRKKKIVISILPTGYNKETGLPNYYYVIYDVAEYFWKKYEYSQSFETWEECAIDSTKYVLDNLI